jgi:hypothetical protein
VREKSQAAMTFCASKAGWPGMARRWHKHDTASGLAHSNPGWCHRGQGVVGPTGLCTRVADQEGQAGVGCAMKSKVGRGDKLVGCMWGKQAGPMGRAERKEDGSRLGQFQENGH